MSEEASLATFAMRSSICIARSVSKFEMRLRRST